MSELEIWGELSGRHPNTLELHGAVRSKGKVTIFMEYMEGEKIYLHVLSVVLEIRGFLITVLKEYNYAVCECGRC